MSEDTPKVLSLVPRLKQLQDTEDCEEKPIGEIVTELLKAVEDNVEAEDFKGFDQAILIVKSTDSDNIMYTYYNIEIAEIIGTLENVKLSYFLGTFNNSQVE